MPAERARITKAVIPAAGLGTRLRPLTLATPKELLPLGPKATAEYIVEELRAVGIEDIMFVISQQKTGIRDYFGESACNGALRFRYATQQVQRGLADAIMQAEELVRGEHFIVALGDTVILSESRDTPLARLVAAYQGNPAFASLLVEQVPARDACKYGMVAPVGEIGGGAFEVCGVVEKPSAEESPSDYAIGGRYIFGPEIFDWIRRTPAGALGEQQITDSVRLAIAAGERVWCVPTGRGEYRYDIGDFEVYCRAFIAACLQDPRLSAAVEAAVKEHRRT